VLSEALAGLPKPTDANLLVGYETADDAAVYKLSDDIAVISTCDFITPPVDDPWWFGQIAAANALSDVWSMGGRPNTALNLVMFPARHLDMGVLHDILRGGQSKVQEAGASLVGGHTVDDDEPKYGLSVNGTVHPDRVLTNAGSRPGDVLVLTKPLGTGVLFNAARAGKLDMAELTDEVLPTIAALNGPAMAVARAYDIHACTDITGFGIAGHALEVALGSNAQVILDRMALPIYPHAAKMYDVGVTTGSNFGNRQMCEGRIDLPVARARHPEELLFDPQTSGGLLFSLPAADGPAFASALRDSGVAHASVIGEVVAGEPRVTVR